MARRNRDIVEQTESHWLRWSGMMAGRANQRERVRYLPANHGLRGSYRGAGRHSRGIPRSRSGVGVQADPGWPPAGGRPNEFQKPPLMNRQDLRLADLLRRELHQISAQSTVVERRLDRKQTVGLLHMAWLVVQCVQRAGDDGGRHNVPT